MITPHIEREVDNHFLFVNLLVIMIIQIYPFKSKLTKMVCINNE